MNREIEDVIRDLKIGDIDALMAGVYIQEMVAGLSLSYGEIVEIEEVLNPMGASMYEETYYELQGMDNE